MTPTDTGNDFAFLKSLAENSAIFVAFTYIGGWSYLSSYYGTFGLNPLELDMPLPVVCTTAVYVLFNAAWPILVAAALWVGWNFVGHYLKRFRRGATMVILALLLLVPYLLGAFRGRQHATVDMLIDSGTLPYVSFSSKLVKTDQPSCVDYQTYGSSDCKLLLHSKGIYYFFTPVPKQGVGSLNVYTLADSDVTGIHILRGLERNAGAR